MNYQEYDWYYPNNGPTGSGNMTDPWSGIDVGTCVGQFCCSDGQTYDSSLNQCVGDSTVAVSPTEGFTTESMVNKVLTKKSGNNKTSYTINGNNAIKPMHSDSFVNYMAKK